VTTETAKVATAVLVDSAPRGGWMPSIQVLYFLFIGGSSTKLPQIPLGLRFVAFLMMVIFIVLS